MIQVDLVRQPIEQHDVLVLCSDGMWDMVGRSDIADVGSTIGSHDVPTPGDAARRLVHLALKRGATDNVTAAVVQITSDRPIPAAAGRRPLFRRGRD
jgi:serine/threonine protein phosphatase PrpC